jgi:hypothetical protein
MTFTINIENGTSLYTAEDIIRYNDASLLYCGDVCLSSVIDKIVEYYEEKLSEMKEELMQYDGYEKFDEGYRAAVRDVRGFVDNM